MLLRDPSKQGNNNNPNLQAKRRNTFSVILRNRTMNHNRRKAFFLINSPKYRSHRNHLARMCYSHKEALLPEKAKGVVKKIV